MDYGILFGEFEVSSLQTRRTIANVKFLYDLVNNYTDCSVLLGLIAFLVPYV